MSFAHLRVASGYSLRHGACSPGVLVERAADLGQPALALTDRDGLYGAVRFALACRNAGIAPLLGVDLALDPATVASHAGSSGPLAAPVHRRSVVRGGVWRPSREMRAVVLARGGPGWRPLCRLVSAAHADRRGDPLLSDPQQCADPGLVVLMGYDSPIGRALQGRRPDLADALLRQWWERGVDVRVAVTSHRAQSGVDSFGCPAPSGVLAARMLGWADQHGLSTVLTHTVRYATPDQARTVDVLDAVRRLVPLDRRHRARANAFGYLADTATMEQIADEIVTAAGLPTRAVQALLGRTRELAVECALSPYDIGIGSIHVPEAELLVPGGEQITPGTLSRVLRDRCHSAIAERYPEWERRAAEERLDDEVRTIDQLGFAGYFLTVAEVVDLSRRSGIRVAARGSGAGSLVTYLLGISGIDPLRHGLLMERFLTPLRRALPDIDIDVESARRTDVYDLILDRFGAHRIACVSMMETYRARHALRDVGAALSLPRSEIDALAKAVPHIRARNVRAALTDLPEVRRSGLGQAAARGDLDDLLDLVEALDGLPRHVAMHPCGVLLSDATLLDRVPVEASAAGYPMCQFDKDDVEEVGLLKLDVLGIRMQSAIAHALDEIARIDGELVDIDRVPLDDRPTFELISSARTLGCFQIESPGQRELIGKFAPETFNDLVIDISLFRPGPVKSDMVTPFLRARQGWCAPVYPHDDLRPALAETFGVVVFHEQVLRIVATMTGCTLAEADETRRSMNTPEGMDDVRAWFYPAALRRGYDLDTVDRVWDILRAFASFGFCKAHAAAFALPTYQSAWLKAHHPAAFFAGILTYDPGMYPKRLILDDARTMGIEIRGVDVNSSAAVYSVECEGAQCASRTGYALRIALSEVKGISAAEVDSILGARPYTSLPDFWYRTDVSRPVVERLVLAGAFDSVYGIGTSLSRRRITRRDLLLQVADLDRLRGGSAPVDQLAFDIGGAQDVPRSTGLPDMSVAERVRAEVEILGLDVSQHLIRFYEPMLAELSLARARDLLRCRAEQVVWVAGVKVATQTPPVRSGRRVVFVTVDDATGPIDATFFEDAQAQYAPTIFHSWLLMIRGHVRRTGPRGVSLRATGCWDLPTVHEAWLAGGVGAVHALLQPEAAEGVADGPSIARRVLVHASGFRQSPYADIRPAGPDIRRLWHASPGSSG